jgi:hypothetical protein
MARDVPDVASWNPYAGNSVANMKAGLDALIATGADVIGLQEMSDDGRWNAIRDYMVGRGWWVIPRSNAIPLYVRSSAYEVIDWKATLYDNSDRPVEPGAGGDTAPTKYITRVSVRHKDSGVLSHHFNLHLIATIEKDGKVGGSYNPIRFKFAQGHVELLKKLAAPLIESGDPVTASADWNVSSSTGGGAWLRGELGEVGFVSAQDELGPYNTHGTREIDDVFFVNARASKFRRLDYFGSDHCPIEVDLGPKDEAGTEPADEENEVATCQNGYPVAFSREAIKPAPKVVDLAGLRKFTVRSDHAAAWQILLDHLHRYVERVDEGYKAVDDWSYAVRPVRGQTTGYSNHSGACAVDYNATQHPLATKPESNFTAQQISRIRELMKKFVGLGQRVFRWGGDYSGRKDPMHFEIIATSAAVRDFVARWKAGKIDLSFDAPIVPVPVPPPAVLVKVSLKAIQAGLRSGSELVEGPTGGDGAEFQRALNRFTGFELVDDGVLGRNTRVVTAQAQLIVAKRNGSLLTSADCWPNAGHDLDLDGIVGSETFRALGLDNSDLDVA